ncbi:MAG: ABC transporter ATP-binding protein [Vallitaleaceae bacterium]|nr:ABC transporter ATP-binding protein [Vallitaleaceae bacterium]
MNIIEISGVTKYFGKVKVLDSISLAFEKGKIHGIMGSNGAGKSTLIKLITNSLAVDSGSIKVFHHNVSKEFHKIKGRIGLVPQEVVLIEELSAFENVKFFASLYKLKGNQLKEQVKEALCVTNLWEERHKKVSQYSGGMKRRLNIACAIMHKPELLIMDEPTVGIDSESKEMIFTAMQELNNKGTTILFISHIEHELQEICHHIVDLDYSGI